MERHVGNHATGREENTIFAAGPSREHVQPFLQLSQFREKDQVRSIEGDCMIKRVAQIGIFHRCNIEVFLFYFYFFFSEEYDFGLLGFCDTLVVLACRTGGAGFFCAVVTLSQVNPFPSVLFTGFR